MGNNFGDNVGNNVDASPSLDTSMCCPSTILGAFAKGWPSTVMVAARISWGLSELEDELASGWYSISASKTQRVFASARRAENRRRQSRKFRGYHLALWTEIYDIILVYLAVVGHEECYLLRRFRLFRLFWSDRLPTKGITPLSWARPSFLSFWICRRFLRSTSLELREPRSTRSLEFPQ